MTWRAPTLPRPSGAVGFPITDAAVAIAVSKCWLARSEGMPLRIKVDHMTCDWCAYPADVLMESACGFWRSYEAADECQRFERLAPSVQRRLTAEAAHADSING
jgi:hypothetical protein